MGEPMTCQMCGRPVRVVSGDEGIAYYEPIEAEAGNERGGLDAAWAAAEAALPEGAAMVRLTWRIGMHDKFPPDEDYEARVEWWSGDDRLSESAYGPTPAAALQALAARLSTGSESGEVES